VRKGCSRPLRMCSNTASTHGTRGSWTSCTPAPIQFVLQKVHVYQVSPALTVVKKRTVKTLASLFGFTGPRAGGIACQGGSSSNLTSIVIACDTLYPECKT